MMLRTVWRMIVVAGCCQLAPAMQVSSQPSTILIKPQYCESVSVPRREMPALPATRIGIMPDRHEALAEAALGWQATGIPLIAFDGQKFLPAGCSDDIGMYYIVPILSKALLVPLSDAVDMFFGAIVLLSSISAVVGLMLICRTRLGRIAAISAVLLISLLSLKIGDVYVLQSSAVLAFVPWVLFFSEKARSQRTLVLFVFVAAAVLASANLVRSHAGTPVLIFMLCTFAFQLQVKPSVKVCLAIAAMLGLFIPVSYSRALLQQRDVYLQIHGYNEVAGLRQHGFWHVIYLGLGYVNNDVVPGYRDEFAAAKVREMAPNTIYASPQYDEYLRREVTHILVRHPGVIVENVAAKTGVLLCFILLSANLGLLAAFYYPKRWPTEAAFWSAIAFESLIGVLAIPAKSYLLGLISFSVLYGVISIDTALNHGAVRTLLDLAREHRAHLVRSFRDRISIFSN